MSPFRPDIHRLSSRSKFTGELKAWTRRLKLGQLLTRCPSVAPARTNWLPQGFALPADAEVENDHCNRCVNVQFPGFGT
jgi:hypothetical protein